MAQFELAYKASSGPLNPDLVMLMMPNDSARADLKRRIDSVYNAGIATVNENLAKVSLEYANSTTLSTAKNPPSSSCQIEATVTQPGAASIVKQPIKYTLRLTDAGKLLVEAELLHL